jgi:hypothetical protein
VLYCEAIEASGMAVGDFSASLEMTEGEVSAVRYLLSAIG